MIRRNDFIKAIATLAFLPRLSLGNDALPITDFSKPFLQGMHRLDETFWTPELANWLDRPGQDLRGHFEGRVNPPWWSCADVIETLLDFMNLTGSKRYDARIKDIHAGNVLRGSRLPRLAQTLRNQGKWTAQDEEKLRAKMKSLDPQNINAPEFRNEYLDDSAWWGIAWLKCHERSGHPATLKTAIAIQQHMAAHWRDTGGVSWANEPDKLDPNSITNSLFIVLSARLHRVTKQQQHLDWALKTLAWEKQAKLYDGIAIVDRPGHQGDYWTYNQGAYLGGLEALHAATGNIAYLVPRRSRGRRIHHPRQIRHRPRRRRPL